MRCCRDKRIWGSRRTVLGWGRTLSTRLYRLRRTLQSSLMDHQKSAWARRADILPSVVMYFWKNPCIALEYATRCGFSGGWVPRYNEHVNSIPVQEFLRNRFSPCGGSSRSMEETLLLLCAICMRVISESTAPQRNKNGGMNSPDLK